jgi:hypothetical protein
MSLVSLTVASFALLFTLELKKYCAERIALRPRNALSRRTHCSFPFSRHIVFQSRVCFPSFPVCYPASAVALVCFCCRIGLLLLLHWFAAALALVCYCFGIGLLLLSHWFAAAFALLCCCFRIAVLCRLLSRCPAAFALPCSAAVILLLSHYHAAAAIALPCCYCRRIPPPCCRRIALPCCCFRIALPYCRRIALPYYRRIALPYPTTIVSSFPLPSPPFSPSSLLPLSPSPLLLHQGVQQPNQFAKVCLNCLPRNSSNLSSRVGQTVQS